MNEWVNGKRLYCKLNRRVQLNETRHFIYLYIYLVWIIILQMSSVVNKFVCGLAFGYYVCLTKQLTNAITLLK